MTGNMGYPVEERCEWRLWVTPKPLKEKPIHRWYTFPHSFTSELVHALIEEWSLGPQDKILDPFVGAGTTLLAAKERGIPATGYDLSPLAAMITRAKIADYDLCSLTAAWKVLQEHFAKLTPGPVSRAYPELVRKALRGDLLPVFDTIRNLVVACPCSEVERNFFHLALLAVIPQFSAAVASGGWLKWVEKPPADKADVVLAFGNRVEAMLKDLREVKLPQGSHWHAEHADARRLPDSDCSYAAVITSPPYPNRHDYTRVFGIELMFAFLNWEETRKLRYQSFHSHPEARPTRPAPDGYCPPEKLTRALARVESSAVDPRVPRMIGGYFVDMYVCLREVARVCRPGARIAFVVGNAQYYGEPVPVDELTAEVGEQAGLTCEKILAVRYRGNSAQQMARYGRNPSRESIVLFRKLR